MTRILVASSSRAAAGLCRALARQGFTVVAVPVIRTETVRRQPELARAARGLSTATWAVVTSTSGADALLEAMERLGLEDRRPRWAVIGRATARAVERAGHSVMFRPAQADANALAAGLPIAPGERVVVVRSDLAGPRLADALRARGAVVDDVVGYRTVEAPAASRPLLDAALATGAPGALVFTSGSTVRGLLALAAPLSVDPRPIPAIAIGPATERAARDAGFSVIATAASPEPWAVAAAAVTALGLPLAGTP